MSTKSLQNSHAVFQDSISFQEKHETPQENTKVMLISVVQTLPGEVSSLGTWAWEEKSLPQHLSADMGEPSCLINYPVILSSDKSVILSSCQSVSHPWLKDELREWKNGNKLWNGMPVTPDSDEEKQEPHLPQLVPMSDKDLNNANVEIKWQGSLRVWYDLI